MDPRLYWGGVSRTFDRDARIGGILVLRDPSQGLGRGRQTIRKPRWLFGEGSLRFGGAQNCTFFFWPEAFVYARVDQLGQSERKKIKKKIKAIRGWGTLRGGSQR